MSYSCRCGVETLHNWPPESTQDMNDLWHHRDEECESIEGILKERKLLKAINADLFEALEFIMSYGASRQGDCRDAPERHFHCPVKDFLPAGPCDCGGLQAERALAKARAALAKAKP